MAELGVNSVGIQQNYSTSESKPKMLHRRSKIQYSVILITTV